MSRKRRQWPKHGSQWQPLCRRGVTADSICTDNPERRGCWRELDNLPDCYVWNPNPRALEIDSWSGECSDGLGTGTGVYRIGDDSTVEYPYVNGVPHGTSIRRDPDGTVNETPYVNDVVHGTEIVEYGPDSVVAVQETPYVNGVAHGTQVTRYKDGRVRETVWVNGDIESRRCVAGCD